MSEVPGGGRVILGIFMVLFGLCIALVGGGCTFLWLTVFITGNSADRRDGAFLFLLSLAALAGGVISLWTGIKMVRNK
jgi:hypothetical protein